MNSGRRIYKGYIINWLKGFNLAATFYERKIKIVVVDKNNNFSSEYYAFRTCSSLRRGNTNVAHVWDKRAMASVIKSKGGTGDRSKVSMAMG